MTGPTRRDLLGAVGGAGLSIATVPAATAAKPLATDFDFPTARLEANGWRATNGSFSTVDSHLVSDGRGGDEFTIAHGQQAAAGTFEMRGVQNTARFYGLQSIFISDRPAVPSETYPKGYMIQWDQSRNGDIVLTRLDGSDGAEELLKLTPDHGGTPTDVRVERDPATLAFECYLDGEFEGKVEDDTYTDSSYWVQRHDAGAADQRVDGVSVDPSAMSATESGSATAGDPYVTDFDHPASALDREGWTVEHGRFRTENSYLFADGGTGNLDAQLSRPQTRAAGTFEFRGVRNEHSFYGLRFAFVSDAPTFGEPPVAGGTQRGYQLVLQNTQGGGPVKLVRNDGDDVETLLTLADDHGGRPTDVRIERDPETWEFHCSLDGEHVGSVHDDTYTDSSYWVQKHGAGDSQLVDGLAIASGTIDATTAPETGSVPTDASADWLDGWYPLVAWLAGVPVVGSLVLATLVALTDYDGEDTLGNDEA